MAFHLLLRTAWWGDSWAQWSWPHTIRLDTWRHVEASVTPHVSLPVPVRIRAWAVRDDSRRHVARLKSMITCYHRNVCFDPCDMPITKIKEMQTFPPILKATFMKQSKLLILYWDKTALFKRVSCLQWTLIELQWSETNEEKKIKSCCLVTPRNWTEEALTCEGSDHPLLQSVPASHQLNARNVKLLYLSVARLNSSIKWVQEGSSPKVSISESLS